MSEERTRDGAEPRAPEGVADHPLEELIDLLEGYRSALDTIDMKLRNCGRNDMRFPKARRMVEGWIERLRKEVNTPCNAAALLEALAAMFDFWSLHGHAYSIRVAPVRDSEEEVAAQLDAVMQQAKDALATPPRNCDIGNEGEQVKRFKADNCDQYDNDIFDPRTCCTHRCVECVVKWMNSTQDKRGEG